MYQLVIIGPFPEPMHGAALINHLLAKEANNRMVSNETIILSSRRKTGLLYYLERFSKTIAGALKIICKNKYSKETTVLLSVDGSYGILYNIIILLAIKLKKLDLYLYHHSSSYVVKPCWLMSALTTIAGTNAIHIVCSENMAEMLKKAYSHVIATFIINNSAWVNMQSFTRMNKPKTEKVITIGFLSNLVPEKGVNEIFDTLNLALKHKLNCKLIIAGPICSPEVQKRIDEATNKYPEHISILGKLNEHDKVSFFNSIDVFFFPSKYTHETQSLVVPEAMSTGVPVIAYDHRFVGELIKSGGGIAINKQDNFPRQAVKIIETWLDDGKIGLFNEGKKAWSAFNSQHKIARKNIETLFNNIMR